MGWRFIDHGSGFVEIQAVKLEGNSSPKLFSNSSEPQAHKVDGHNLHVPVSVNPRNFATVVYLYLP